MSNKTQLQTNNASLDGYIARINAAKEVAASLPEAGGGSGGANIETCTVKAFSTSNTNATDGNSISHAGFTTYDENGLGATVCSGYLLKTSFENVVRNSLCVLTSTGNIVITENCSVLYTGQSFTGPYYVMRIDGDCTIKFVSNPCFVKGTMIKLANNTEIAVENVSYSDELLVWDFDNACYTSAKPLWIKKAQTASYYYRCEFENSVILDLVGSNGKCHRLFNVDKNRFESATDCIGSLVAVENGISRLISCERIDEPVEFYNIITEYHLNLFANSVLTSCRLNNLYPIENMKFTKEERPVITKDAYTDVDDLFYDGLRLGERKAEDIEIINEYIHNLMLLKA